LAGKTLWTDLKQYWKGDLIAAFSVALVALPLGLGISIASGEGVSPMAGIVSAIIGGLVTTFIRGSHVGINGPGAGLIGVTIFGVGTLSDAGLTNGFEYYLAAVVIAGIIQVLFGVFKLGKYGDFLPSSVVRGMLAAIGIIIFASQIHIALDTGFPKSSALESIKALPNNLKNINWPIAIIAINSLAILILHPLFINKMKLLHYIPAPMLVLLISMPFVFLFDLTNPNILDVFGTSFAVGPDNLMQVDENFINAFNFRPNFDKANTMSFWLIVVSIFLVSSIESLLSSKAVDKLDPQKRTTNLNKDLFAAGASTILAGFLGGLPVITVIVRSSVNINHGARTKWSNFFHGLILLTIVFFFTSYINLVPTAALAAILVYTGYKLASPKMFADTLNIGYEQFIIVAFTLFATIKTDLIMGLGAGIALTILIQLIKSHSPFKLFYSLLRNTRYFLQKDEGHTLIKVKGISNFTNIIQLSEKLQVVGMGQDVIVDFSQARLVDHTVLEFLNNWGDNNIAAGGQFDIVGLDNHITTSQHPLSLHILPPKTFFFLSKRQHQLKGVAAHNGWIFRPETNWSKSRFRKFHLFESRALEFSRNIISGEFRNIAVAWEVADITFDEGAFLAAEVHHITALLVQIEKPLPKFVIEKDGWLNKILDLAVREEIIFDDQEFTDDYSVKGPKNEDIKAFFKPELINFFMENKRFHIESDGKALLIFKNFRFAGENEIIELIDFSEELVKTIYEA
jgi:carbonic anhydrase